MTKKEIEEFDDEIDLREIILAIWNRKVFLIAISILFAYLTAIFYRSDMNELREEALHQ